MNAEEGATFGPCTGVSNSRAMVGTMTMGELETVKNRFGQTKLEAMKEYGLVPDLESAKRAPESIKILWKCMWNRDRFWTAKIWRSA